MTSGAERDEAGVRVRIAPSPTGYFHVGNARTALFNWLFARQNGGVFVVRVEDTDQARLVEGALEDMYAALDWLGLKEDESPRRGGPFGPYVQSERTALYREHVETLLSQGHAYRCYCSSDRLTEVRGQRGRMGLKMGYDRHCRNLSAEESGRLESERANHVVRLKVPLAGELVLNDSLRGEIHFPAGEIEDAVLMKSDGLPTYHLAVVVDDHFMEITHVLRADEWIPSAPIQVALYAAFGWQEPVWAHVPLVLNPGGKGKLAKRKTVDSHGHPVEQMTQVREFRQAGYLPEALFNYLALQGWSYDAAEDVFSVGEALAAFRLEDIKSAPAAWNPEKLDWLNGVYVRQLEPMELAQRLMPFLNAVGLHPDLHELAAVVPLIQERIVTLRDAPPLIRFLWAEVEHSIGDLVPAKLGSDGAAAVLAAAADDLAAVDAWTHEAIEVALRGTAERLGVKPREAFQPIRVALTGALVSPPLFESAAVLGRDMTLARLRRAAATLPAATVA